MATVTDLAKVNRDVTEMMQRVYGERLAKIVLFGSYARGDYNEDSDIDYLVVLDEESVSPFKETKYTSPIISDYHLETGIHVSPIVVAVKQLLESTRPFFKEVRKDQQLVYER